MTFWGFIILGLTIIEAFGPCSTQLPRAGHRHLAVVGFLEDFFGLRRPGQPRGLLVIRIRQEPAQIGRESRFGCSHTGGAWLILASIAISSSLFIYCGAQINNGTFRSPTRAFVSCRSPSCWSRSRATANRWIETVFIIRRSAPSSAPRSLVLYSKHIRNIFLAPFNVLFSQPP